jgi:hypothetical protein
VEPQTSFIRAEGAVEFNPESSVDLIDSSVILPRNSENNLPFRLDYSFENFGLDVFGMPVHNRAETIQDLFYSLQKLRLAGIALYYLLIDFADVNILCHGLISKNKKFIFQNFA